MPRSVSDKEWQKQSDASTLAEAQAIQSNSKRLKGAQEAAKKMAEQAKKNADNYSKVSGSKKSTGTKK